MSDWTVGQIDDLDYTYGYFTELNPVRLKFAFSNAGLLSPKVDTACELGFGQGISTNIHAAASLTTWEGTDIHPAHVNFARRMAEASGTDARFHDQAFSDFVRRSDLSDFDYIGLHGIWSWISDEDRIAIVDFVRRKLKPGGVLYISYNVLPGWAPLTPIRHLMYQHAEIIGAEGRDILGRLAGAQAFLEKLMATSPAYARANPRVGSFVKQMVNNDRRYLAGEYLSREWHPMNFATVAQRLAPAHVTYACSASYHDHVTDLNLTQEQQLLMREIRDPGFRQTVYDFLVNRQFRYDYWVKGGRDLSTVEQAEALRAERVILTAHRSAVSMKMRSAQGESTLIESVYNAILDALADLRAKTLGQLEQTVKDKGIGFADLVQAAFILAGNTHLAVVQDEATIAKARSHTDKLNIQLINKARSNGDISFLASPVTGGGIHVGRFEQLFLLAMSEGKTRPDECVQFVWQALATQGEKIVIDGKILETTEENIAALTAQFCAFTEKQLPILQALQIVQF
jgi:SAM-dependent methyltransferase